MTPAIVIVLPVPVAPSRVVKRPPPDTLSAISSMAFGWSAAGVKIGSRRNSGMNLVTVAGRSAEPISHP